jgi:hypothetical protein
MKTRPLLALATLVLLGACGRKADPLPPLRRTPPAPPDFRLSQRGAQIELEALAPGASIDGVAYTERVAIEFLHGAGGVDLDKRGRRKDAAGTPGQKVLATLPLPAPGTLLRASARAAYSGQRGARTVTKALVVQAPLEAPRELQAVAEDDGVHLVWQGVRPKAVEAPKPPSPGPPAPATAAPGTSASTAASGPPAAARPPSEAAPVAVPAEPPLTTEPPAPGAPTPGVASAPAGAATQTATPPVATSGATGAPTVVPRRNGFSVYRRSGRGGYRAPLAAEPLERRNTVDEDAPVGERLCYVVRAVASTDPLIESDPSNEACVERRDTTPPAAPAGLAVLPSRGGLEVLWSPSSEPDLAGYRVYRKTPGEPRQRLAELGPDKAAFLDETAAAGTVYRYTVSAFDQSGNESEPAEPREATLP